MKNSGDGNGSTDSARSPKALALAAVALFAVAGCGAAPDDPETELRAWIAAMESAAEQEDRGAFIGQIADAYADARGNTRSDLDGMLRLYFLRADRIALLTTVDTIAVAGGTAADVALTVGMAGSTDSVLGFSADAYRFELELERQGDGGDYRDWKLLSARWGEMGDTLR